MSDTLVKPSPVKIDTKPSEGKNHIVCEWCYPKGVLPRFALCGFMLSEIPPKFPERCEDCFDIAVFYGGCLNMECKSRIKNEI